LGDPAPLFLILKRVSGAVKRQRVASVGDRYQPFNRRRFETSLEWNLEFRLSIKAAKWSENNRAGVKWRGLRVLKDPFTLSLYMTLLWELKPESIVEIGSFEGGSALWMADMTKAMGLKTRVISYDIQPPANAFANPRVAFKELDVMNITRDLSIAGIRRLPRPLLVIEDAHKNLFEVLNHLSRGLTKGDYLIVEDTCDIKKHREFARFMKNHRDTLLVDTNYTDNFGYNASWNWNSFLRQMK